MLNENMDKTIIDLISSHSSTADAYIYVVGKIEIHSNLKFAQAKLKFQF
jgi:hypothetical protein